MKQTDVAIVTDQPDLARQLTEQCPEFRFLPQGERALHCAIAIIDGSEPPSELASMSLAARIFLTEHAGARRSVGDLSLPREQFLAQPRAYLAFSRDLAEASARAALLREELEFLEQMQELVSMANPETVSAKIAGTLLAIIGQPRATLLLPDPASGSFQVGFNNDPDFVADGTIPSLPARLLEQALSSRSTYSTQPAAVDAPGLIVMPLQVHEDLIGIVLVPLLPGDSADEELIARAARYTRGVTAILGNIYQLTHNRDLAMLDDLTKAFNRRFFESYLDDEIERSRRYEMVLSVIFLDLDDLKLVNNLHGHLAGSRTLQEVAKRILGAVRTIDRVVRFGGDEFCIILPQTDQEQARLVATRVRKAMVERKYEVSSDATAVITASFGIATYPVHGRNKEELIQQADAAMYRVKSTTKNAIGIAETAETVPPAAAGESV